MFIYICHVLYHESYILHAYAFHVLTCMFIYTCHVLYHHLVYNMLIHFMCFTLHLITCLYLRCVLQWNITCLYLQTLDCLQGDPMHALQWKNWWKQIFAGRSKSKHPEARCLQDCPCSLDGLIIEDPHLVILEQTTVSKIKLQQLVFLMSNCTYMIGSLCSDCTRCRRLSPVSYFMNYCWAWPYFIYLLAILYCYMVPSSAMSQGLLS